MSLYQILFRIIIRLMFFATANFTYLFQTMLYRAFQNVRMCLLNCDISAGDHCDAEA
uniref:Uncharacterized protein n=1 Tax=Arundo donax TaxID=35708 RepID=A0A0A9H5G3_ARUDO